MCLWMQPRKAIFQAVPSSHSATNPLVYDSIRFEHLAPACAVKLPPLWFLVLLKSAIESVAGTPMKLTGKTTKRIMIPAIARIPIHNFNCKREMVSTPSSLVTNSWIDSWSWEMLLQHRASAFADCADLFVSNPHPIVRSTARINLYAYDVHVSRRWWVQMRRTR